MFWFSSVWSSSAVSAHTFWDIDPLSHRCHGYSTCWSSFPKTSYTQSSRPQPLAPPQHTSGSALITRNVPTLCVHSSPSSPCASHTFHEFSSNPPHRTLFLYVECTVCSGRPAGDWFIGRSAKFPVSCAPLLMLILWLTDRPIASS